MKESPKPKSQEQGGKSICHLLASIHRIGHIPPHTVRRPGAMPLYILQGYIMIKSKGGTRTSESVEGNIRRIFS